ncbi:LOW QUALITY PROTEIN: guanine nucleotide exchange factor VAV3-like [Callospermophilus lateralis]
MVLRTVQAASRRLWARLALSVRCAPASLLLPPPPPPPPPLQSQPGMVRPAQTGPRRCCRSEPRFGSCLNPAARAAAAAAGDGAAPEARPSRRGSAEPARSVRAQSNPRPAGPRARCAAAAAVDAADADADADASRSRLDGDIAPASLTAPRRHPNPRGRLRSPAGQGRGLPRKPPRALPPGPAMALRSLLLLLSLESLDLLSGAHAVRGRAANRTLSSGATAVGGRRPGGALARGGRELKGTALAPVVSEAGSRRGQPVAAVAAAAAAAAAAASATRHEKLDQRLCTNHQSPVWVQTPSSKVIETLSRLSRTPTALATGIRPFPTEESVNDEDIYKGLPDLIDETGVEDEEDLYDCVYGEDEGGEVYEDLMKAEEAHQPKCPENDIRSCCLAEIKQTEEKYTETLESIEKYFMAPLKRFLTAAEFDSVFINIPELVKVHRNLMQEIHDSIVNKNDQNLYQVFINYKERLVIYGQYCSGVESAISNLDYISKTKEDVRLKLEECSKRANNGKFTLRDLLVVPMQCVLKYHLLLQLVKHTTDPIEKANLKLALDAMKDLAQYVNEVKRDNETLRVIKQFQLSIENLNQPVLFFGRPQGDGEIRITTLDKHTKQERHIFLFDLAVIVCKRKGDNYEMKEIIDLQQYKIANNPTTDKENKKWSYGFYLIHIQGQNGLEFYCKTKDLKKKWLEQFEMAL